MKYKEERPLANLDAAVSKLLAIANGMEADHAGRLQDGAINEQFLGAGGNVHEYMAAVKAAIDSGYITNSPIGCLPVFHSGGGCFANSSRFCGTVVRAPINADSGACLRRVSR